MIPNPFKSSTVLNFIVQNNQAERGHLAAEARRAMRYRGHKASLALEGRIYEVTDWSFEGLRFAHDNIDANRGGVYFEMHPAPKAAHGDAVSLVLRFDILDEHHEIPVMARILRKGNSSTVVRFAPLPAATRRKLERARDMLFAQDFLSSQQIAEA